MWLLNFRDGTVTEIDDGMPPTQITLWMKCGPWVDILRSKAERLVAPRRWERRRSARLRNLHSA